MINSKQPVAAGYGQIPRQFMQAGSGGSTAAAISIAPKEILDILRRHLFLIISLTVLGAIIGSGLWYVLKTIVPKYTAGTYIEVLNPGQFDPTIIATPLASKDIAYEFRFSKAALIKQQNMLQELIRRDAIRETNWFKSFNNDVIKTIEDLKNHLGVVADRNSSYISINMTCGSPKEAALIVNQMVDLLA
jgi:capsular polysaccharide biosynthesis protein